MKKLKKGKDAIENSANILKSSVIKKTFVLLFVVFFIFIFLVSSVTSGNEENISNENISEARNPILGYNTDLIFICNEEILTNESNVSDLRNILVYKKTNESNESRELKIVFNFDFNSSELNLSKISVLTESSEDNKDKSFGYTIIKGLEGIFKNVFVKKLTNYSFVCVKDFQIFGIEDFSSYCNSTNEILLKCNYTEEGFDYKNISSERKCFIFNNSYLVTGINNSGIIEGCFPNFICTNWSSCISWKKSRICYDINNCSENRTEIENCSCVSNWNCSEWSSCIYQKRKRNCIDLSNCTSEKVEEESCICSPSYTDCSNWSECSNGISTRICEDVSECTEQSKVETRNCYEKNQELANQKTTNAQTAMIVLNVSNSSNESKEKSLTAGLSESSLNLSYGDDEAEEGNKSIESKKGDFESVLLENSDSKSSILSNYRNPITGFVTKNLNQGEANTIPLIILILIVSSLMFSAIYARKKNSNRIIIDVDKLNRKKFFNKKPKNKNDDRKLDF